MISDAVRGKRKYTEKAVSFMMINRRLIGTVGESRKYIAGNVLLQWLSLLANIGMMASVTMLLAGLFAGRADGRYFLRTALAAVAAVAVRFACTTGAARMGYLSSKAVKKTLRAQIYEKLLRLGAAYREQVRTSEIVQVAVEGVDQLETYFGAYLPQFFYAMLAPLTLFAFLCFVNVPAAVVLLVCVPLIPIAIAAVQTWAKKLLAKYWGQYTALGDTFLENLQGLTTLKIYEADGFKNDEMNVEAEKFRRITMKVLTNRYTYSDAAQLDHDHGPDRLRRRGARHDHGRDAVCGRARLARGLSADHFAFGGLFHPDAAARQLLPHRDERHGGERQDLPPAGPARGRGEDRALPGGLLDRVQRPALCLCGGARDPARHRPRVPAGQLYGAGRRERLRQVDRGVDPDGAQPRVRRLGHGRRRRAGPHRGRTA